MFLYVVRPLNPPCYEKMVKYLKIVGDNGNYKHCLRPNRIKAVDFYIYLKFPLNYLIYF